MQPVERSLGRANPIQASQTESVAAASSRSVTTLSQPVFQEQRENECAGKREEGKGEGEIKERRLAEGEAQLHQGPAHDDGGHLHRRKPVADAAPQRGADRPA
jgi:hypothetical protein